MRTILETESGLDRQRQLLDWCAHLPVKDFPSAYETLRSSPLAEDLKVEMGFFMDSWLERDLRGALAYFSARKKIPGDFPNYLETLSALAMRDPQAASRIVLSAEEIPAVRNAIVLDLSGSHPAFARDLLEQGFGRGEWENIGKKLLDKGFDQTTEWLEGVRNEKLRQEALFRFAHDMAEASAQKAAAFATNVKDGRGREELLKEAARKWLENDPEAAKAWITSLPDGLKRKALYGAMLAEEPESSDLPSSPGEDWRVYQRWALDQDFPGHDQFILDLLKCYGGASIENLSLAARIEDPELRQLQYARLLGRLLKTGDSASELDAWITNHPHELGESLMKEIAATRTARDANDEH